MIRPANALTDEAKRRDLLLSGLSCQFEEMLWVFDAAGLDATATLVLLREWEYPANSTEDTESEFLNEDGVSIYEAREQALLAMPYDEYLRSPEWAEQRRRARLRAGDRCQGCDSPQHLEVHHRTYERLGQEEPGDLTVLCAACHTAVHLVADGRRGKVRAESRRAAR